MLPLHIWTTSSSEVDVIFNILHELMPRVANSHIRTFDKFKRRGGPLRVESEWRRGTKTFTFPSREKPPGIEHGSLRQVKVRIRAVVICDLLSFLTEIELSVDSVSVSISDLKSRRCWLIILELIPHSLALPSLNVNTLPHVTCFPLRPFALVPIPSFSSHHPPQPHFWEFAAVTCN